MPSSAPSHVDYQPPADQTLAIVYRDDTLLVVDKPAGLLSVPGRGADRQDCLIRRVQRWFDDALVVHRLDMETSGLLILARGKGSQSRLGRLFQQRAVQKGYVAVVEGRVRPAEGEIDLPLICDWPNRPRQKVDHQLGKPSLTRYAVLGRGIDAQSTRLVLQPETGRSHQLRVHLQALGHPILGDRLYAKGQTQARAGRLLLHATSLMFEHPVTGEPLRIISEAPF
ncbi:MAG TPA: RNA pseudouridine synthase [Gammaproteobacteria bacterium]|nr:RNA pseudouridine synthase [Gammaproteobacteria bacterium]